MWMKKKPQYVQFRCGRVHFNSSLEKIGENMNGYFMLKMMYYQLHFVMLDIQWVRMN